MAGGKFDRLVGKVRPGTYTNFESGRDDAIISAGVRGTVIVPLQKTVYGPARQFIKLTNASPDAGAATFGYSIYDDDENRQMLLIREAFKKATTVYVYILTEGKKASAEIPMSVNVVTETESTEGSESQETPPAIETTTVTMKAVAKHGGTRGNDLAVTVDANPLGGYDVIIHLGGSKVTQYEGLYTIQELIEQCNPYITFSGEGNLGDVAGVNLEGGTDEDATNMDVTTFIDAWEQVKFHTVCFPFTNANLQQAALTKVKYMRDSMGKGVQVVMPDTVKMDYEGVINVTNSISIDGNDLSHAEVCAWVAGATAGATNTESLTYIPYAGATAVVDPKNNEESIAAINRGEFFFSVNENEEVVVEYDINSLVTFSSKIKKDKSYRKNRIIRVFDTFQESVQLNFPPNKFDNDDRGWDIMEGVGKAILRQYYDMGAITNVSYDADFLVDREASYDDETFFNVGLQAVDSAEKLYFTITTR